MSNSFLHSANDQGYIIAWKYKYEFQTGKYEDEVMTYGEAMVKVDKLHDEHPDMTFWPEEASDELANRFYRPEAH